jgi:hypothetical protein
MLAPSNGIRCGCSESLRDASWPRATPHKNEAAPVRPQLKTATPLMCLRNIHTKYILHHAQPPTKNCPPAVAHCPRTRPWPEPVSRLWRAHWSVHFGLHACPLSMPIDASLCRLPFSPQISRFCLSEKWAAPETRRRPASWLGVTVGIAVCDATLRRNADHRLTIHADMNEKSFAADNSDEFYNVTQQNR